MNSLQIQRIPKSELHLHLRGAIPVEVFTVLLNRYQGLPDIPGKDYRPRVMFQRYGNIRPFLTPRKWTPEEVSKLFQFASFDQFLATYHFTSFFVRDLTDFRMLVQGVIEQLRAQQVVYAEITVSAIEYIHQGITLDEINSVLCEASDTDAIQVQWIIDLVRNIGPEKTRSLLEQLIELNSPSIVGITIGGSEHLFPPALFEDTYRIARESGLRLTVHAGEALGAESVWDALKILKAERIGHGVRAVEDPALMDYLAEHQIPLEICPTSNLRTGIYPSYEAHPIRRLFEAGVPVTISTDDPTFFGTTLCEEYEHIRNMGFTDEELLAVVRNGFRHAFLATDYSSEKIANRQGTIQAEVRPR